MIKIQTISFVLVTVILGYSLYENHVILFFSSLLLFPIIIVVKQLHTNGLPKIRINKFSFNVKTVKKQKSDMINEILLGISVFQKFNSYFGIQYSKDIEPSGVAKTISAVSIKNLRIILISIIFSIIFSIALFFVTYHVVSFLFLLLPVGIYMLNRYELRAPTIQRKNGVENELLFFSIFCDIMDSTQSKLYHIFEIIICDDSKLFTWIKKEGIILNRDVTDIGDSPLDALKNLANIHPSRLFAEFIQGYLTSQSAGGRDTGDYLVEKTREYHVLLKQKMSSYVETSDSITQIVSFGLIMYPIMIILSSTMTSGENLLLLIIFGFFFIPVVIFALIKKIESISPFSPDHIPIRRIPIISSAVTLLICVVIQLEYWECLIFPLIIWSIINHIMIRKILTTNYNIDQSIPRFVRDINQSMLGGSSFLKSFNTIQEKKPYSTEFNQILHKIKKDMQIGEQINHIMLKIYTTSHLSKLIIRIISYAGDSGEITPSIMEKLAIFSNNYLESKTEINNKTTISIILTYVGSLIVIVLVLIIPSYNMNNFTSTIQEITDVTLDDTLTSLNLMLVTMTSFLSMVLVSKIRYGTVKHSIHSGIVLCVILIILYYEKMIGINF